MIIKHTFKIDRELGLSIHDLGAYLKNVNDLDTISTLPLCTDSECTKTHTYILVQYAIALKHHHNRKKSKRSHKK